jgi:hypothetical protein
LTSLKNLAGYKCPSLSFNEGKSAASFCRQVAAWFPVMFCNFCLVKNHKITNDSTTTKAREKISTDLESLSFFYVRLTKFKNNPILLNKISHRFLLTTSYLLGERASCECFKRHCHLDKSAVKNLKVIEGQVEMDQAGERVKSSGHLVAVVLNALLFVTNEEVE